MTEIIIHYPSVCSNLEASGLLWGALMWVEKIYLRFNWFFALSSADAPDHYIFLLPNK